jgi:hypothetical protein
VTTRAFFKACAARWGDAAAAAPESGAGVRVTADEKGFEFAAVNTFASRNLKPSYLF